MNLIRGNNNQYRGDALVPKAAMKIYDCGRLNLFDLTEVDDRTVFLAEDTFYAKLLKSTSNDKGMWHSRRCTVELLHARKKNKVALGLLDRSLSSSLFGQ